jgi:hypothetical protein
MEKISKIISKTAGPTDIDIFLNIFNIFKNIFYVLFFCVFPEGAIDF